MVLILVPAITACGSQAPAPRAGAVWPSRRTPRSSTLGWFDAINAHDRSRLLSYVAPDARGQMAWARPAVPWSKFTDLHCHPQHLPLSTRTRTFINCTFDESESPVEGTPDSFWNVELRAAHSGWLIEAYGPA